MRWLGVVIGVALFAATSSAANTSDKAGEAFLPPPLPTARDVASLGAYEDALIELDRVRAHLGAPIILRAGGELIFDRLQIWRLPSQAAQRIIPILRNAGALRAVEADRSVSPLTHAGAADPLEPDEWWIPVVGADAAEPPGPGKPVSVIDTGLETTHPEFASRPNTVLLNSQSTAAGPGEDHGTAVSSVVAAPDNGVGLIGVYPRARLFEWDAGDLTLSEIIAGIREAADVGPGVINMSFGSPVASRMEEQAVLVAFGMGSLPVAAAGNEFQTGNPLLFPASYNHVLTAAATNQSDGPAEFSNANLAVDLATPGQDIPVAVPTWANASGYDSYDGTSFSAPLVSGGTAWVWTRRPRLDNTQVFDLIRWSARDVWTPGFDEDTGFGILDIPAALNRRAPATDHQEPNDDIYHVKRNGLFRQPTTPLTAPGRGRKTLKARMDITEDPEDVYRVWVPRRRWVNIRVVGNRNVNVELWKARARTVHATGAARRRTLIDGSYRRGTRPDWVFAYNSGRRGRFVYLDVFLPRNGPLDARYSIRIRTTRT